MNDNEKYSVVPGAGLTDKEYTVVQGTDKNEDDIGDKVDYRDIDVNVVASPRTPKKSINEFK